MVGARAGLVAIVTGLVLMAGCSNDEDPGPDTAVDPGDSSSETSESPSPSETSSPSPSETADPGADAPACSAVWKDGARLPRAYQGCNEGTGESREFVARDVLGCSSGQRMVRYDEHFYAVLGGDIHRTESRLDDDAGYGDAVARCRG